MISCLYMGLKRQIKAEIILIIVLTFNSHYKWEENNIIQARIQFSYKKGKQIEKDRIQNESAYTSQMRI